MRCPVVPMFHHSRLTALSTLVAAACVGAGMLALSPPASAQNWKKCVEAIAKTQEEFKTVLPKSKKPQSEQQSIAAQDSMQPTPESLAAAGLSGPTEGAEGALNQAQNLQAMGDEAGCMKAVQRARALAGLK